MSSDVRFRWIDVAVGVAFIAGSLGSLRRSDRALAAPRRGPAIDALALLVSGGLLVATGVGALAATWRHVGVATFCGWLAVRAFGRLREVRASGHGRTLGWFVLFVAVLLLCAEHVLSLVPVS